MLIHHRVIPGLVCVSPEPINRRQPRGFRGTWVAQWLSDLGSNHGVDAIFGPIDSLPCSEILRFSHNQDVMGQLTFIFFSFLQYTTASSIGSQLLDERAPRASKFWWPSHNPSHRMEDRHPPWLNSTESGGGGGVGGTWRDSLFPLYWFEFWNLIWTAKLANSVTSNNTMFEAIFLAINWSTNWHKNWHCSTFYLLCDNEYPTKV